MRQVPAADAMNRIYRHQRFVYDATRKFFLPGRDRLIADLAPGEGTVLEIGCGTARNLVRVAKRHPGARLFGLDVSSAMLATAERALKRRGLEGRVRLILGDATLDPPAPLFGRDGFDRVYLSYVLSMITDWRAALEHAAGALAPGGRLLVVDFGRQEALPSLFERALTSWLARFAVHPVADLPEAVHALAVRRGWRASSRSLFRGYAVYLALERPPQA